MEEMMRRIKKLTDVSEAVIKENESLRRQLQQFSNKVNPKNRLDNRLLVNHLEGVSFESILRYVLKHTNLTEEKARHKILEVLKAGEATKTIVKTRDGLYVLVQTRPGPMKISDPDLSHGSSESDSMSD